MTLNEKFAIAGVASVLLKFVLAGTALQWAGHGFTIGPVDGVTVAAILTPILGALHLSNSTNSSGS